MAPAVRGDAAGELAGDGRCGGVEVDVGGRARDRRGQPGKGDAEDHFRGLGGCGGGMGVGGQGWEGSSEAGVGLLGRVAEAGME